MSLPIHRRQALHELPLDTDLNPVLRRVYYQRPLRNREEVHTRIDKLLTPDRLAGISAAVELLCRHLAAQENVLIVSDFDADGATSCALAVLALRGMGFAHVDYIVPNRFRYGYGLTPEIVDLALQKQPRLIITVDNGISSLEGVAAARAAGVEVLITDHHLPGSELPDASAIVNPNQQSCEFPSKSLAGVGVIFYVMAALRSRLRSENWFTRQSIPEPNLADFLDLVALGTVADVVPLDYNNRVLVAEGLNRIRSGRCRPGIVALLELSQRRMPSLAAADLGFAIGPRLNAAGRLDDMSVGIECLLAESRTAAWPLALELDGLNRDRRLIESDMKDQALANLDHFNSNLDALPAGLCLYEPSWHQGVIGILASRIKDRYQRPVIAFADGEDAAGAGLLKGSARSINGYHIRDALDTIAARHPGLLLKFGGHAMAAGLSIAKTDLEWFTELFAAHAAGHIEPDLLLARQVTDGELQDSDLNLDTAEALIQGGPWGQSFPEPTFDGVFKVLEQREVGSGHLRLRLCTGAGLTVDGIAFNVERQWLNQQLYSVRLVYRLDINEYRGQRSLQLVVLALQPESSPELD